MFTMEPTTEIEPISVEHTTTSMRRRKKSFIWDHFTIENLAGGSTRACCKQCKQTFAYSSGSNLSGTTHLKRHILMGSCQRTQLEKKHLLSPDSKTDGSAEPPKRRYRMSSSFSNVFDQEQCTVNLAKMIIMHEYQLHMVEHPVFVAFVRTLQPRFQMPDVNAIEGQIMSIYHREKHNVSVMLGNVPGRVCLTIGLWATSQTLGYVCLTGHFIDSEWKFHKRMLNFMMVSSPHSENALSEAIGFSLSEWNMKNKLFTITLDNNCSSHDIYSANLRDHLSNKNTLMLKGQLFVVRCYAHILNVIAQDVIASIHGIVYNIRESVKYVKASVAREEKFTEIAQQLQIPSTKILSLDVQMQWNSTYLMLVGALDFRHAFTFLETCDPNYNEAPSTDDWIKVEIVCTYLKLLYDSANVIMRTSNPTSNVYFHEASKIQLELRNATWNEDPIVSGIAKEMHEKFDKYWKDCGLVLAIAVVMDPRFKMKLVEFSFNKIYGEDAASHIKLVSDSIHELYQGYAVQPLPLVSSYAEQRGHPNSRGTHNMVSNNVEGLEANVIDANAIDSRTDANAADTSILDTYATEADAHCVHADVPKVPYVNAMEASIPIVNPVDGGTPVYNAAGVSISEANAAGVSISQANAADVSISEANAADTSILQANASGMSTPEVNDAEDKIPKTNATETTAAEVNAAEASIPDGRSAELDRVDVPNEAVEGTAGAVAAERGITSPHTAEGGTSAADASEGEAAGADAAEGRAAGADAVDGGMTIVDFTQGGTVGADFTQGEAAGADVVVGGMTIVDFSQGGTVGADFPQERMTTSDVTEGGRAYSDASVEGMADATREGTAGIDSIQGDATILDASDGGLISLDSSTGEMADAHPTDTSIADVNATDITIVDTDTAEPIASDADIAFEAAEPGFAADDNAANPVMAAANAADPNVVDPDAANPVMADFNVVEPSVANVHVAEDNNAFTNETHLNYFEAMSIDANNADTEVSNIAGDNSYIDGSKNIIHSQCASTLTTGNGLLDFDIYISEMAMTQQTKSELDQYLEEALTPRIKEFDILYWWKLNTLKYPTLSKMARDILSIPISIASSTAMFGPGTGSRMLDEYRSSLRPETVEALFCTNDWLQYAPPPTDSPAAMVKMEL